MAYRLLTWPGWRHVSGRDFPPIRIAIMINIFLSYAEEDRETARKLSEALASIDWSVGWERDIPAGKDWRTMLEEALASMSCMVVLWSKSSIKSDWVKEEAEEGLSQGKLVPVLIEAVKLPVGFRFMQAADLLHWDGSVNSPGFQQLIRALKPILGKPVTDNPAVMPGESAPAFGNTSVERNRSKVGSESSASRILRRAEQLPWWSYAATTVIVTVMLAASLTDREITPPYISPGALPVKALDADELKTDMPPITVQVRTSAHQGTSGELPSASASIKILGPLNLTGPTNPVVTSGTARTARSTAETSSIKDSRCRKILLRGQLDEPLGGADREFLRKECQ